MRSSSAAARWGFTMARTALTRATAIWTNGIGSSAPCIARPKFMKGNSALAKYVVNGWELDGIVTLASGRPSFESVSFSSTTNLPQAFTGTLNGLGGDNRVPFLPNNPLRIDPITRGGCSHFEEHSDRGEDEPLSDVRGVQCEQHDQQHRVFLRVVSPQRTKGQPQRPTSSLRLARRRRRQRCAPTTPGLGTASAGSRTGPTPAAVRSACVSRSKLLVLCFQEGRLQRRPLSRLPDHYADRAIEHLPKKDLT